MICDLCKATIDERKIYVILEEGNLIFSCSRCYPIKDKEQTKLGNEEK